MAKADILVVDDETSIREVLRDVLEDEGYAVHLSADAASAREAFSPQRFDLILLDIWMPDVDGISLLKEWHQAGNTTPVVMISGHGTVETAVEAIQLGAYDFLEKPLSTGKLLVTVNRALEARAQQQEIAQLKHQIEPTSTLVGNSDKLTQLREQISRIGKTQSWVMISGPAGSGKGVAARGLHQASPRAENAFVEISLAAIPKENIARRLFGSEDGEAVQPGCFEQADGGTLYLDEVADLDADTQTRLLSALQAGRFLRVGGQQPVAMNVRVLSSSRQPLGKLVEAGEFREDLYYRLNVVPLSVPPLREHLDDLPALVEHFVERFTQRDFLPYRQLDASALNRLRQHSWPGNVRELENLVQRMLISGGAERVDAAEIEQLLGNPAAAEADHSVPDLMAMNTDLRNARDHFERQYFEYHLDAVKGNVSALAEVAGLERTHLYRKLKALNINPKDWK